MNFEISFALLSPIFANAAPVIVSSSPDLKLEVWLPICLVGLLLIAGLVWCYCYFRRFPYEIIEELCTEGNNRDISNGVQVEPKFVGIDEDGVNGRKSSSSKGKKSEIGLPVGLRNNGSDCYMNSTIQALASSDRIIQQFKATEEYISYSNTLKIFMKLIEGVNNENNTVNITSNTILLKSLLNTIGWHKVSQQDCMDFMSAIINAIHRDLKQAAMEMEPPMKFEMLHKVVGCNIQDRLQYHIGLSLALCGPFERPPGVNLEYLLTEHLSPSNIDGDSLKTTQIFFYQKSPDVLVLHIQANRWNSIKNEMVKPEYHIQYDKYLHLNLSIMTQLNSNEIFEEKVNYKLQAVIHHIGAYSGGHYITYRNFNGFWILSNDEQIERVNFDKNICPYILIYEKLEEINGSWI